MEKSSLEQWRQTFYILLCVYLFVSAVHYIALIQLLAALLNIFGMILTSRECNDIMSEYVLNSVFLTYYSRDFQQTMAFYGINQILQTKYVKFKAQVKSNQSSFSPLIFFRFHDPFVLV